MRTEQDEIAELMSAVEHFAQALRIKLIEEVKKGKRGWDEKHPEGDLCEQIRQDAKDIQYEARPNKPRKAVDIANRAMMIWYRAYGKELMHGE